MANIMIRAQVYDTSVSNTHETEINVLVDTSVVSKEGIWDNNGNFWPFVDPVKSWKAFCQVVYAKEL